MNALTVSQVNTYIKALINEVPQVRNLYIIGEISNYKHYYQSGHMYFTLKDDKSQLKCVMFSFDNQKLKFRPDNGMKVICFGQIDVYERDGVYQLYVRDMHPEGIGSLTLRYEELKAKLEKEGLFDASKKKPLPKYPERIGVVTSNMGAAVEDIKNVLSRRYPLCEVVIVPTVVQGDSAPNDIVRSLAFLDSMEYIDLIIVGRGGGSLEDLWAFNTEVVARAVYSCRKPVISAVGHETDFTICDFVADLRAPTPSAAAELAVPEINSERQRIDNLFTSMEKLVSYRLEAENKRLDGIKNNSPLADMDSFFASLENALNMTMDKLGLAYGKILSEKENSLKLAAGALNALSPLGVLSRGYSIVRKDGKIVKAKENLTIGDKIEILIKDGSVKATVDEV